MLELETPGFKDLHLTHLVLFLGSGLLGLSLLSRRASRADKFPSL